MSASSSLPIHAAASSLNPDALRAALAAGDSPDALDAQGQAPLHILATKSFRNEHTFPMIVQLLDAKANINLANKDGASPIQVAAQSGWQDTVAFLLQRGAKLDAESKKWKISCPDCRRVLAQFEGDNYEYKGYKFENPRWAKVEQ
jgi:ankyrin repeat protein